MYVIRVRDACDLKWGEKRVNVAIYDINPNHAVKNMIMSCHARVKCYKIRFSESIEQVKKGNSMKA